MSRQQTPGVYVLIIRLSAAVSGTATPTGEKLKAGWYVYVGSAMGGLEARLARHLRTKTVRHWHVDRLLAAGRVADVQCRVTSKPQAECLLAREVSQWPGAERVPRFGNSDCRCPTHLHRFRDRPSQALSGAAVVRDLPRIYGELRRCYTDHAHWDHDPFETLVSCILSLRTQDPVTEAASERLLKKIHGPRDLAAADPAEIARLIFPVGMYRQKAARLVQIATLLLAQRGGKVPAEIDDLLALPGVGRKTANLVRSFAFHLPAICVDTHVHRITNRWGLVRTETPDQTEFELRRILPAEYWIETNAFLVQHGQQVCRPTRPRCSRCPLTRWCHYPELCREAGITAAPPDGPRHPSLALISPA